MADPTLTPDKFLQQQSTTVAQPNAPSAPDTGDLTGTIALARQAGYQDPDIVKLIGTKRPDLTQQISDAWKKGYTPTQMVDYLGKLPAPAPPDVIERGLNYQPGNMPARVALGLLQGAGKGTLSSAIGIQDILRQGTGQPDPLTAQQRYNLTVPSGPGQGTGKALEQVGEFAVPSGIVGDALKGASIPLRIAAQSGIGGAVSAAQSGGDPLRTALGAALGGAGEAGSALWSGITKSAADTAPTALNFSKAFEASGKQNELISDATPYLQRDGIQPGKSLPEMQGTITNKLADLSRQYNALDPAIPSRTIKASDVLTPIQNQQRALADIGPGGEVNVIPGREAAFNRLQKVINTVRSMGDAHGGTLTFDQLRQLRDAANEATPWAATDADKNLWRTLGDTYRNAMDQIAPETTPLNRDWQMYGDLSDLAEQNVKRLKGQQPTALMQLVDKYGGQAKGTALGAGFGTAVGHATGLPISITAPLGGIVGGTLFPKLTGTVLQAIQNAVDNGTFARLPGAQKAALSMMMRLGDAAGIMRLLGQGALSSAAARTAPTAP